MNKKEARLKRARKSRAKILELRIPRLSVHRTLRHMFAQVFSADNQQVLASASTVEKSIRDEVKNTGCILAAAKIGKIVAERALKAGITKVAFDRSGNKYHGRVKAVADAAREAGLEF
jgi:large subunit ribosomal protein L18